MIESVLIVGTDPVVLMAVQSILANEHRWPPVEWS